MIRRLGIGASAVHSRFTEYRLGRSIAQIVPFYRHIRKQEIITNKILIIMAIVAIVKITVFILPNLLQ